MGAGRTGSNHPLQPEALMSDVGKVAPNFLLASARGSFVTLSDYRGRPVLLVFLRHLG